ncbi:MAG: peptide ABC transporter substrate-binding protein [Clostridia bacterium]|nr:peptide ABC transporter substrate-binding protein [Clostridia bacterium]
MKKMVALLLSLLLALGAVPAFAEADEAVYRTLYSGEIGTLNYLTTGTTNEFTVSANIIDTLVERDCYGNIVPCLAESWELSDDGLTWTFHLRDGATWVTADGEYYADVTAYDFETAAQYVLDAKNDASNAWILSDYLAGAEDYYSSTELPDEGEAAPEPVDWATVGVKALDEKTIAYTTVEPVPFFLSMLDYSCYMPVSAKFLEEKGDEFGLATGNDTVLYCGAYILSEFKPQESRVYTKNEAYWDAEHVYITKIQQTYNKEASTLSPELYLRGEIDAADITTTIASEWLADPEKADLIHPVRQVGQYSYFFCFNFDPRFDDVYEPENWKLAVNNENFRKSLFFGLDRLKAKTVIEPDNPADLIWDSLTPASIVVYNGKDYAEMVTDLTAELTLNANEAEALAARDAAVEELTAAGATFPVKVLMCYNPSSSSWAEECQVVEQQLEGLLGADYIDVIVEAGPSTGFLKEIRRSGKYAFMKCNWGLDYDDPENMTSPFKNGNNYNFYVNATQEDLYDEDGTLTYFNLLAAAGAISTTEPEARYQAYATAEAYLINHAVALPFGSDTAGYTASRLNPFEAQFAPTGLATCRYKGQHLLDKPMSTDEYYDAYDAWLEELSAQGE